MSKRNKLKKFAEILSYPNVYENFDPKQPALQGENGMPISLKGKWREQHFKNEAPIVLELACGKGEYTLGLAERYPEKNFIGVDVKGARIWKGASEALEKNMENVAFLRTRIEQITYFFEENEVDEIWITFPDPFLKKGKENRRLTAAKFIDLYRTILKPNHLLHLKTDDETLYEFSLESLKEHPAVSIVFSDDDIYAKPLVFSELEIKTYYEKMHLAEQKKIKYIRSTIV